MDNVRPLRPGPEELMDDRYLLDTFMEHTPDHVYFKDDKSRFIRVSRALALSFGLDNPSDAIGRTDFDLGASFRFLFAQEEDRRLFAQLRFGYYF